MFSHHFTSLNLAVEDNWYNRLFNSLGLARDRSWSMETISRSKFDQTEFDQTEFDNTETVGKDDIISRAKSVLKSRAFTSRDTLPLIL